MVSDSAGKLLCFQARHLKADQDEINGVAIEKIPGVKAAFSFNNFGSTGFLMGLYNILWF